MKRYDCEGCRQFCYGGYHMKEQEFGDWVRFDDVELLITRMLPQQLTPPLRRVLGMMLWETGPIAHAMRAAGRDIARKAEDEQAVVLHWLLGIVLEHGADWSKHAARELRKLTDSTGKQNV